MHALRVGALLGAAFTLGGCLGDNGPSVTTSTAPSTINLAGRWALTAAGSTCAMNLTNVSPIEGAVRPEGGCGGNFFTSRKWTYEGDGLIIRDHNDQPLARLKQIVVGHYEGQATGGQAVSLVR